VRHIPNALTLFRGAVAIYLPFAEWGWLIYSCILLACVTDLLDGFLARELEATSAFGARADALIDKVFVAGASIYIVRHVPVNFVEILLGSAILLREVVVEWLRIRASRRGHTMPSSPLAKWKTASQMALILLYTVPLMPPETLHYALEPLLRGLLAVVAALTVLSASRYVRDELRAPARA